MGNCLSYPTFVRCPECHKNIMESYPVTRCTQCDVIASSTETQPRRFAMVQPPPRPVRFIFV